MWLIINRLIYLVILLLMSQLTQAQRDSLTRKRPPTKVPGAVNKKTNSCRWGKVLDRRNDEPIPDVVVTNLRTGISKVTDWDGSFVFQDLKPHTDLKVSGINIKTDTFHIRKERDFILYVNTKLSFSVASVNTGVCTERRKTSKKPLLLNGVGIPL